MNCKNQKDFQDLYTEKINTDCNDDKFYTKTLMYRFLSEVERVTEEKNISRRKLAELVGTSPSYITQLYRGNKIISIELLSRIERALDFEFTITAKTETEKMLDHLQSHFHSIEIHKKSWIAVERFKSFSELEEIFRTTSYQSNLSSKYNSMVNEDSESYKPKLKIVA